MHGFLNIDKPTGITSHDVVAQVRRLARQKRVGHAGTLDPAATGVLVVALGTATRLIEYVQDHTNKRYTALVRLGITTATDDAEGDVLETRAVPALDPAQLEQALAQFRGLIAQVPPQYSALHHDGRRLYELARAGVQVDIPARPVQIDQLTLLAQQDDLLTLDVCCGKGTYIRALARDLGAALGCGAHLQALRRTAVGAFLIDAAVPLAELASPPTAALLPPEIAVADWPAVTLSEEQARRVRNGMPLACWDAATRLCAYGPDGVLLALLVREGDTWRPAKVFDWS